jgi:hypothetical protein
MAWADTLVRSSQTKAHNTRTKELSKGRVSQGLKFKSANIHHKPPKHRACTV